jgi:hypothetical protein
MLTTSTPGADFAVWHLSAAKKYVDAAHAGNFPVREAVSRTAVATIATARALVAHDPEFLMNHLTLLSQEELMRREGISLRGKWIRRQRDDGHVGYTWLSRDGQAGLYARELPSGTDVHEVMELPATPPLLDGRDELTRLLELLDSLAPPPPVADLAAQAHQIATHALCASTPGYSAKVWATICGRLGQTRLQKEREAYAVMESSQAITERARNLCGADAVLLGAGRIALALAEGFDRLAIDPTQLPSTTLLQHLGAPGAATWLDDPEQAAEWLAKQTIRHGGRDVVRALADQTRDAGDELLEQALDVGTTGPLIWEQFYWTLYEALPSYWVARKLFQSLAKVIPAPSGSLPSPDAMNDATTEATCAEERLVRVSHSIVNGYMNIDGLTISNHQQKVARARATQGDRAANAVAIDLIENWLFYPRAAEPLLLGDQ